MATAAYLTLSGWQVTLCDTSEQSGDFAVIAANNGILLRGKSKCGCAMPVRLTVNFSEALANDLVVVCTSTGRHKEVIASCLPHVRPGHRFLFSPGNLGSYWMRKALQKTGQEKDVVTADLCGNLWACRRTAPAEVLIASPGGEKRAAAFPAADTPEAVKAFSVMFPMAPCANIFEAALNSPNVISHVIGAILNAVQIEQMKEAFAFFRHGLGEVCVHCMGILEKERNAVMEALNLAVYNPDSSAFMHMLMDTSNHPQLDMFRSLDGPSSFSHRYVSEDASCGVSLLVSLGTAYNVPTPVNSAILTLAGAINETDYLSYGYTLQNLSLDGISVSELIGRL